MAWMICMILYLYIVTMVACYGYTCVQGDSIAEHMAMSISIAKEKYLTLDQAIDNSCRVSGTKFSMNGIHHIVAPGTDMSRAGRIIVQKIKDGILEPTGVWQHASWPKGKKRLIREYLVL